MNERAKGESSLWEVGQELDDYQQILETANSLLQDRQAVPERTARCQDPDPAVHFWGLLGLAVITQTAGSETVSGILPSLKTALQDDSVSLRLTAAEGLCNLGHYQNAAPVLTQALACPIPAAQIRAACILDSQPPEASADLQGAIGALQKSAASTNVRKLPGIPYGLNDPFGRALKAIRGEVSYYRWGMGASGAPENPLMKVQELPFVPRKDPDPSTKTGKASPLKQP